MATRHIPELAIRVVSPLCWLISRVPLFQRRYAEIAAEIRRLSKLDALPPLLAHAVIVSEDHRFYQHQGVDPYALVRALVSCVWYSWMQGASTIEQQLVRTISNRRELTISRKLVESLLAVRLCGEFTKGQILRAYGHSAYYGFAIPGYVEAAERIGVSLASARDCARVAARLKRPSGDCCKRYAARVNWVVRRIESLDQPDSASLVFAQVNKDAHLFREDA